MISVSAELLIVLLLILVNGLLAMTEIAIVSARKVRLHSRAEDGDSGATTALELANEPGSFLSTVQIGITLVGILAGAFGGATLAGKLATQIERIPVLAPYAPTISIGAVVVVISYLTLVIGELTPKRIGLSHAEAVAVRMAVPMKVLARATSPLVRLLDASTEGMLALLRIVPSNMPDVTDDEIKMLLQQGRKGGVFEPIEEEIVSQVFRLSDRTAAALITPRPEIVWLNLNDQPEDWRATMIATGHSLYPVAEGDLDNVVGIVKAKDLMARYLIDGALDLRSVMQPPLFVPETIPALGLLERFRITPVKLALIIDEYGGLLGLVTVNNLLEDIVGEFPELDEEEAPEVVKRDDGSWLVDGRYPLDEFQEFFEIQMLPPQAEGYYFTVGGFVMAALGHVPHPGDHFRWGELDVEVLDMDGRRVDKILVSSIDPRVESEIEEGATSPADGREE